MEKWGHKGRRERGRERERGERERGEREREGEREEREREPYALLCRVVSYHVPMIKVSNHKHNNVYQKYAMFAAIRIVKILNCKICCNILD